jgi:hypothetical protein
MNTISRRLEAVEQRVEASNRAAEIPEPFDTLTEKDQALLRPYLAARRNGTASDTEWPIETHRAMNRYLGACVEYDRLRQEAGVPMRPIAETLRAGFERRRQGMLAQREETE